MKSKLILFSGLAVMTLWAAMVSGQGTTQYSAQGTTVASAAAPPQGAVSYASVTQLNGLLGQLETTSKATQADLAKLRIEHWKTDGSTKNSRWRM
jgi:hypothetical protein